MLICCQTVLDMFLGKSEKCLYELHAAPKTATSRVFCVKLKEATDKHNFWSGLTLCEVLPSALRGKN